MTMSYVKFFPSDWRAGASGELNLEEEGLYVRGCVYMWDTGQPIPGDDAEAARRLRVQVQKYSKVMQSLITKGKMIKAQGVIVNQRVMEDIDAYRQERAARAQRAAAGHANKKEESGRWELLQAEIADLKKALMTAQSVPPPGHPPHLPPHPPGGGYHGGTSDVPVGVTHKKCNEINETTEHMQSTCTAIPESRSQNPDREEDSPLTPQGGEAPAEQFPDRGSARQQRAARAKVAAAELEQAVETFNKAARHFGFTAYTARTGDTDKRLARRLEAVGGHEQFRAALLALRVETPFTRFLLGKVAPRDGERTPFKLDIHALLQTKGNLGDVLQRLLQAGQTATVVAEADQKQPWATWDEAQWRVEIKQHANGIWPTDKIGFWPGHPRCAAPPGLVAAMQTSGELAEYDDNGMKKRGR